MRRATCRPRAFLDIAIDEATFPAIVEHCSFDYMKAHAGDVAPVNGTLWEGGAATFIHKGTNGRWRDVLTAADIAAYEHRAVAESRPRMRRLARRRSQGGSSQGGGLTTGAGRHRSTLPLREGRNRETRFRGGVASLGGVPTPPRNQPRAAKQPVSRGFGPPARVGLGARRPLNEA
jgi:hypothetical protein